MLQRNPNEEVAVIFQQGMNIQVPPFEVPTRRRFEGETYEDVARTLCQEVGIQASISYGLSVPRLENDTDKTPRLYLMNDETSGFTAPKSDFMVHIDRLPKAVGEHPYLSDIERALFWAVIRRIEYSSL